MRINWPHSVADFTPVTPGAAAGTRSRLSLMKNIGTKEKRNTNATPT